MKKTIFSLMVFVFAAVPAFATPLGNGPAVFGSSSEPSLQDIISNVFYESSISAVSDQSDVRVWSGNDGGSKAYEVAAFAGNANTVGIYDYVTGNKYAFDFSGTSATQSFEFDNGALKVSDSTVGTGWSGSFGFYLSFEGNTFFTEDDKNGSATQAVAYQIAHGTKYNLAGADGSLLGSNSGKTSDGGDDWLIAFEDISYANSDKDFNDAVFYVKDLTPVPEPTTLLLFGSGLIGLAFLKRRKS